MAAALKTTSFGEITRFDLSRKIAGRGRYWTTAYLVDGLMVDTGCAHTSSELGAALQDLQLSHIVNTHSHEDHIGANTYLPTQQPCRSWLIRERFNRSNLTAAGFGVCQKPRQHNPWKRAPASRQVNTDSR